MRRCIRTSHSAGLRELSIQDPKAENFLPPIFPIKKQPSVLTQNPAVLGIMATCDRALCRQANMSAALQLVPKYNSLHLDKLECYLTFCLENKDEHHPT